MVGSADDPAEPIFQGAPHTASNTAVLITLATGADQVAFCTVEVAPGNTSRPTITVGPATDLAGIQGTAHCFLNESKLGAVKYLSYLLVWDSSCNVLYKSCTGYPSWPRGVSSMDQLAPAPFTPFRSSLTRPIRSILLNIHDGKPVHLSSSSTSPGLHFTSHAPQGIIVAVHAYHGFPPPFARAVPYFKEKSPLRLSQQTVYTWNVTSATSLSAIEAKFKPLPSLLQRGLFCLQEP